jgi:hypothetical protein
MLSLPKSFVLLGLIIFPVASVSTDYLVSRGHLVQMQNEVLVNVPLEGPAGSTAGQIQRAHPDGVRIWVCFYLARSCKSILGIYDHIAYLLTITVDLLSASSRSMSRLHLFLQMSLLLIYLLVSVKCQDFGNETSKWLFHHQLSAL